MQETHAVGGELVHYGSEPFNYYYSKWIWCHKINSHEINCHQINCHQINSHKINFLRDQFNLFLMLCFMGQENHSANTKKF